MDIIFTTLGVILVLAVWPALVLYAGNDSMLRNPRRRVLRTALAKRRGARTRPQRPGIGVVGRPVVGASTATPGVPAPR